MNNVMAPWRYIKFIEFYDIFLKVISIFFDNIKIFLIENADPLYII